MSTFSGNYDADSFKKDDQVEEKRLILDVVEVILKFFSRVLNGCAVVVTHLRPASYARFDAVTHGIKGDFTSKLIHKEWTLGARPN
jgi:hypothetical protein